MREFFSSAPTHPGSPVKLLAPGMHCHELGVLSVNSGYASISLAHWMEGGIAVILKQLNPRQWRLADETLRDQLRMHLLREAAVLGKMDSGHLPRLFRLVGTAEQPVLVLERLAGDLAKIAPQMQRWSGFVRWHQVLRWGMQVNYALAELHQAGFRHLDLKPANLLLTHSDPQQARLKLADLGCALAYTEPTHHPNGTPGWQAPEQYLFTTSGWQRSDYRADYYALGLLLFYLLTGSQLNSARQVAAGDWGAAGMGAGDRQSWQDSAHGWQAQGVSAKRIAAMWQLLRQMLAVPPAERPVDGRCIAAALQQACRSE